jgi:exodeoxyribonuclease VII large subunit
MELKGELLYYKQQMFTVVKNRLDSERNKLISIEKSGALKDPVTKLNESRRNLLYLNEKLNEIVHGELVSQKLKFSATVGKLNALNPLGVIARGYAMVSKGDAILTKVSDFNRGDTIDIKVSDGRITACVTEISEG